MEAETAPATGSVGRRNESPPWIVASSRFPVPRSVPVELKLKAVMLELKIGSKFISGVALESKASEGGLRKRRGDGLCRVFSCQRAQLSAFIDITG